MIKGNQPENPRIGAALRKRRLARKLTQEQLAEHVPCHPTYVGMVERGQYNISFATLYRFAKALDTTVASIARSAKI